MSDRGAYPGATRDGRSLPRRAARAAFRRVDAMFSRNGPAFRRLAVSWAANVGGDTLVTVALAGTLFFSVPSSEARGNVALYLGLTLAPFTIVAPVLGGVFARFR
ncbi:MAG TPA: MFS transporter, partial [Acidimicrobiia bacterium]|nr:MFS transporter [Acidimicrobiia bacterium]